MSPNVSFSTDRETNHAMALWGGNCRSRVVTGGATRRGFRGLICLPHSCRSRPAATGRSETDNNSLAGDRLKPTHCRLSRVAAYGAGSSVADAHVTCSKSFELTADFSSTAGFGSVNMKTEVHLSRPSS